MKKITTIFVVILILISSVSTSNATGVILNPVKTKTTATVSTEIVFTRSLTIGSYGQDVMALKKILSLETDTTETGATFTQTTANNVKKLQEKYAVEILIPNGLSAGTGYVGPATIKKLNLLTPKHSISLSNFTLPVIVAVVQTSFSRTLSLGSVGDDVALLKTILNSDPATALIPKNSTNIFDAATVIAVKKFQEKYASEILTPAGLTSGTGLVGPGTRKKLNALLNKTIASIKNDSGATSSQSTPSNQLIANTSVETSGGAVSQRCDGTTLVVTKSGFDSTYDTKTVNSSQCGGTTYTAPYTPNTYKPYDPYGGTCEKITYKTGPWGVCGSNSMQTRTVTEIISTTTCPYYDYNFPPQTTQQCSLPECADDQDISVGGTILQSATCLNSTMIAFTFSPDTLFYNNQNQQCRYMKDYVLWFTPIQLGGAFGMFSPDGRKLIAEISTNKQFCLLIDRSINDRLLKLNATVQVKFNNSGKN